MRGRVTELSDLSWQARLLKGHIESEGPCLRQDLLDEFDVPESTLARYVRELKARDYIEITSPPDDARESVYTTK